MNEHILYEDETVAVFMHNVDDVNGVEFLTDATDSLQVGILRRQSHQKVAAHKRVYKRQAISSMHQMIYVMKGKLLLTIYDENTEKIIRSLLMVAGDLIILQKHAHGVEFLEETLILEVKQGPYPGDDKAKFILNDPAG